MLQNVYYDPFRVFAQATVARHKPDAEKNWTPAVDITETSENYQINFDLPGVVPTEINVLEENGVLTVSGKRSPKDQVEGESVKRLESHTGKFSRQFTLPEDADTDSILADSKNGILSLRIERKKPVDSRKTIEVKAA